MSNLSVTLGFKDDDSNKILEFITKLSAELVQLSCLGVSHETIDKLVHTIITDIKEINLREKVDGFEEYLRNCSSVYSKMEHYTADYAFAVDEVLKWYRKWFNKEEK